jgi:hypothetical protein
MDASTVGDAAFAPDMVKTRRRGSTLLVEACSGAPKTYAPLCTYQTTGAMSSSTAVLNGIVYIGDFFAKVYGLDAAGNTNCSGTPKVCEPLKHEVLEERCPETTTAVRIHPPSVRVGRRGHHRSQ